MVECSECGSTDVTEVGPMEEDNLDTRRLFYVKPEQKLTVYDYCCECDHQWSDWFVDGRYKTRTITE